VNKKLRWVTSRQPSNASGFRRLAFTKPAIDGGKEKKQQVNPALRLRRNVGQHFVSSYKTFVTLKISIQHNYQ
jgi:hypothetical protein